MTAAASAIAIDGLVKQYGGLRPLRLKHLEVEKGERVVLSGFDPTAAEVLVNLVNGAILPDQGEVKVFGRSTRDIADEADWFNSLDRLGILTPRAVLLEMSTVEQNLALPFTIDFEELTPQIRQDIDRLAGEVELPRESLASRVDQVSIEQRMRVHLAKAIAMTPDLLLLEHPTVNMKREHVVDFGGVIGRVSAARGLTIVAMTEDVEFANAFATAHYRVHGGTGALTNVRGWRRWLG